MSVTDPPIVIAQSSVKRSAAENYTDMVAPCSSACAGVPRCLTEELEVVRATNLQRSTDRTVRLGHEYGYSLMGRSGRENEE